MSKLIAIILPILFMACSGSVPTNSQSITKEITIEHDKFKNQTWIRTPLYLSRQGFTDSFPVKIMLRALYRDNERIFTQLYVTKMDVTWGFYHSAYGEDGHQFEFTKVNNDVDASSGMVTTTEHFVLDLPQEYVAKMSQKDWVIKVYGKNNEGTFVIPMSLSRSFESKLECYEANKCG